jgi:hypothetical protein
VRGHRLTEQETCPDCGVRPGERHKDGCDVGGWPTFPVPLLWPDSDDERILPTDLIGPDDIQNRKDGRSCAT